MGAGSDDIADFPNPDLAVEVDISRPETDRAGIYAALRVTEVWRFDRGQFVFERLTPEGTYAAVETSGFLPVRPEDIRRWLFDGPRSDWDWDPWVRAEVRQEARGGPVGRAPPADPGPSLPTDNGQKKISQDSRSGRA